MVADITQSKHFDQNIETRMVCDASTFSLGAALEPNTSEGWVAIACASTFVNSLEDKYSENERELLGVFWAIDHLKYYLYGKNDYYRTPSFAQCIKRKRMIKKSQSTLTR